MSVSVCHSVCPSVCDGSALAHYSSFTFQIPIPIYRALWSRCMRVQRKGSSPGRVEGSSRAMLATARPSCLISQNGRRRHLDFSDYQHFISWWGRQGWNAPSCQISSKSVNSLWRYCNFSFFFKMAAACHLGIVWGIFGPRRELGGHYHCAKFGYDQYCSFDNMNVSIL